MWCMCSVRLKGRGGWVEICGRAAPERAPSRSLSESGEWRNLERPRVVLRTINLWPAPFRQEVAEAAGAVRGGENQADLADLVRPTEQQHAKMIQGKKFVCGYEIMVQRHSREGGLDTRPGCKCARATPRGPAPSRSTPRSPLASPRAPASCSACARTHYGHGMKRDGME